VSESSLVLLREVAIGLDGLLDRIVFIGGAIAPLLQVEPPFGSARPTGDVDAIAVTVSYSVTAISVTGCANVGSGR
jgi:hypothetical protein